MDLISEYNIDALPVIDREYDDPAMREIVDSLIVAEMRSFTPKDYLAHLPNLDYQFTSSSVLKNEFDRYAKGISMPKMDYKRYDADKPSSALENDVQAWRNAVSNVKSQQQHQENRLMNIELDEEYVSNVWLHYNSTLEQIHRNYVSLTDSDTKALRELNKSRQDMQEKAHPDLWKLHHRRDKAIVQRLQCQAAYQQIDDFLTKRGFSYTQHCAEQAELQARDLLSAQHNDTVRSYETVNESMDVEVAQESHKRSRIQ